MPRIATTLVLAVSMGAALWTAPARGAEAVEAVSETAGHEPADSSEGPELAPTERIPAELAAELASGEVLPANVDASEPLPAAIEPAAESRPQPVPAAPAGAKPLLVPADVPRLSAGDDVLGALWNLQERLDQLERENARLTSNLNQLQAQPSLQGRSARFFQLSPLRTAAHSGQGAAPVHYETELAGFEQHSNPDALPPGAVILPPDDAGLPVAEYTYGSDYGYAPVGSSGGECFAGVFELSVDWLNWKANRDGLDFVVTGDDNDVLGPGVLKNVKQGRDNGVRIALFRKLDSRWDFGLRYVEFDLQGRNSVVDPTATLTPTRIHPSLAGADIRDEQIAVAISDYDLQYDLYDVESGHSFAVGSRGLIRPFGAVRSARIDQELVTRYSDTPDFSGNVVIVNETVKTSSVGMLLGSEAQWHVRECWSVFGRAAAGLHVGTSDVSHVEIEPDDGDVNVQVKEDLRQVLLSFETAAGVGCRLWNHRPAAVDLQLGYEIQYWDNLPDYMRFVDDANEGINDRSTTSLGLDGFFGRIVITR